MLDEETKIRLNQEKYYRVADSNIWERDGEFFKEIDGKLVAIPKESSRLSRFDQQQPQAMQHARTPPQKKEDAEIVVVDRPPVQDLAPSNVGMGIVEPIIDIDRAVEAVQKFQDLKAKVLDPKVDIQEIKEKMYIKRSGWRKIALCFNLSHTLIHEELIRDDDKNVISCDTIVRVTAPNGRTSDGRGNCSISERKFSKPNHDIPAISFTRSLNRATADICGSGEVSAEEMIKE